MYFVWFWGDYNNSTPGMWCLDGMCGTHNFGLAFHNAANYGTPHLSVYTCEGQLPEMERI